MRRRNTSEALGLESLAAECRLSTLRRSQIATEILDATTWWETVTRDHGIGQAEITRFERTFTVGAAALRTLV